MTTETIIQLPINEYLVESPFNPRKSYPEAELQELAASIQSQGVMQPIVVRHIPHDFGGGHGDMEYQIVFGHRRYRASKLAGLDTIPAIVRQLDDQQAAIAQAHENSKRKDVSAIEEADSFDYLRREHGLGTEQIMEAVGKSRSYVYGRLKLVRIAPEVRRACSEEGLSAETALEIARLPHHDLQRAALKACENYIYTAGGKVREGWVPTRQATSTVRGMFDIDLTEAPFDLEDAKLNAKAGDCGACPKRAGNDPDLEGVLDPNICTEKACYTIKLNAHIERLLAKGRKSGQKVIEGDDAKEVVLSSWSDHVNGFTTLKSEVFYEDNGGDDEVPVTLAQALERMGKKAPKPTLIVHPHKPGHIIECLTDAEVDMVLEALGQSDDKSPSRALMQRPDPDENLSPEERAVWHRDSWDQVLRAIMRRVVVTQRTTEDLRIMAHRELELGDDFGMAEEILGFKLADESKLDESEQRTAWLETLDGAQLAQLLLMIAIQSFPYGYHHPAEERRAQRLQLAERFGVNVLDPSAPVQAPADGASTPSPAARAQKKAKADASKKAATKAAPAAKTAKVKKAGKEQKVDAGAAGGSDAQAELLEGAGA